MNSKTVSLKCASAVEAEPSEPEERSSENNKRNVVRKNAFFLEILSRSKYKCKNERAYTGADMYNVSACKVNSAELVDKTLPHTM